MIPQSRSDAALTTHAKMGLDLLPFRLRALHGGVPERTLLNQALYESANPEARRFLHQALLAREEPVRLFAAQALELLSTHHFAAIETLHAALTKNPEDAAVRAAIADRLMEYAEECVSADSVRRHFYKEAASHLIRALEKSPDDPALLLRLGRLHFVLGEYAEATEWLERIPRERAEYPMARWTLAEVALAENRISDVRAECERLAVLPLPPEIRDAVRHWSAP